MTPRARRLPVVVRRLLWPTVLLAVVTAAVLLLPGLGVPMSATRVDPKTGVVVELDYGQLAVGIAAVFFATRLLDFLVFDLALRFRRKTAAPALLRQIIGLLVFGIGVSIVFKVVLFTSLTALLTTSAIITAVVGLALQDTLGNLFAGLSLHLEKSVEVGDMVRSGELFGSVEQLSWRAIKVRTLEGNVLLIPNSLAGRERLEVYPRPGRPIARILRVGLEYQASPAGAREVLEGAVRDLKGLASHPSPTAYLYGFSSYAIEYELRYWLEDYGRFLEIDSHVRERVWYALERAGMKIAYPVIRQHQYAAGPLPSASREDALHTALDRADLLAPLSIEQRRRVAEGSLTRVYGPGETIVEEGETGSSMFLVVSGRVGVSIHGAAGDSRRLAILEPGSAFGEISFLTGDPRTATVRALTEATLVEIHRDTLAPILAEQPTLVEALEKTVRERRRRAAELLDATREEMTKMPEGPALGTRIARFFGLGSTR